MKDNTITDDKINEIRSSVDIVEVISEYIPLTGKGRNYFGVCPFHDDHSPSMSVSKDRQIFKCFSCGAGGNVFTFVKDYENISFLDAVKKMADRAGIFLDVKTYTPKENTKYQKFYEIYDIALKFYKNNINTKEGKEAREYLESRQITSDMIKEFEIGLSLKDTSILTKLLQNKGFTDQDILQIGLATEKEHGIHDIYYHRIMFPLYDLLGRPVGFSGRIYQGKDTSKYINTKETPIFKKGEILYHYDKAKNIARQKDQIIVVEGFMDVIRLYAVGITNTVATMGTAVTKEQLNLIRKMAKEIILMFDGDLAGQKAAYHTSTELNQLGIASKIVLLEDQLDPDEYILKYGKDKIEYKIAHPMNMLDFKLEYLKKDKDISSPADQAKYVHEVIKELNTITDLVLQEVTLHKLAEITDLEISFLKSQLQPIEKKQELSIVTPKKVQTTETGYQKAEKYFVFYMLNHEEVVKIYHKQVRYLPTDKYRLLAKEIDYFYQDHGYVEEADIISAVRENESLRTTLDEIMNLNLKEEYSKEEIQDYVKRIKQATIRDQIAYLKMKQRQTNDTQQKSEYGNEITDLMKQLAEI